MKKLLFIVFLIQFSYVSFSSEHKVLREMDVCSVYSVIDSKTIKVLYSNNSLGIINFNGIEIIPSKEKDCIEYIKEVIKKADVILATKNGVKDNAIYLIFKNNQYSDIPMIDLSSTLVSKGFAKVKGTK